jgi:hypothetical protein
MGQNYFVGTNMANGEEDLKEKDKDREKPAPAKAKKYRQWSITQGREDAEMLMEKSSGWSAVKDSRGDYDYDD